VQTNFDKVPQRVSDLLAIALKKIENKVPQRVLQRKRNLESRILNIKIILNIKY
jgi:hypothetical protein